MKFNCVHDVTDYNVILWYCQRDGREYTLMGYLLESYETNANQQNSLTINSLNLNDSGVYFCAASTVLPAICILEQKLYSYNACPPYENSSVHSCDIKQLNSCDIKQTTALS